MKRATSTGAGESPSDRIDHRIAELGDWRGETLAKLRALILQADPEIVEEWKWMGTPVWSRGGIVCTGESYKTHVKTTFAKGAFVEDPKGLFNSSLEGNLRRAIDFHEGEKIDAAAFKALIRAAVALNLSGRKSAPAKKPTEKKAAPAAKKAAPAAKKAAPATKNAAPAAKKRAVAKKSP